MTIVGDIFLFIFYAILFIIVSGFIVWPFITILYWIVDQTDYEKKRTLVEIVISQYNFIKTIIITKII